MSTDYILVPKGVCEGTGEGVTFGYFDALVYADILQSIETILQKTHVMYFMCFNIIFNGSVTLF